MKQFWKSLASTKLSTILLVIFILIISLATFIEEVYDTQTAKLLIYNAKWFEFLMILFIVLFIFNIIYNKLFSLKKLPQLIFHISFILLIIGGGITRYFGYEANMHILENESVDVIYTTEPYFQLKFPQENIEYTSDNPLYFSQITKNKFHLKFNTHTGIIEIKYKNYIFEAHEEFLENADKNEITDYYKRNSNQESPDALLIDVIYKGKRYETILFYDNTKYTQPFKKFSFNDLDLELTYGPKPIDLPFALMLKEFTLSKYPGTNIPSASESKVILIDKRCNLQKEHVIAKNKVLDYDGYRFFQTSYDDDEKGTILSLNYDYYGTRITYFGYFLMIIGAVLVLILKKSHFSQLDDKIKEVRVKRKSLILTIIFILGFASFGLSQNNIQNPINYNHAKDFGHLLVQTYEGRFTSVHSLASDVIHKISNNDNFNFEGKGEMDAMHLFLDIHVDPEFWKNQKIIKVQEKEIRNLIGISDKKACFNDFFSRKNHYKLDKHAQIAFKRKASEQTTFDREVIKVTEKVNILIMTLNGTFLKIFPVQKSDNNNWISWNDSLAYVPITGNLLIINDDLKLPEFNYNNIMRSYYISTIYARESNDYTIPNKLLKYIGNIQRQFTPEEILPPESKINFEIFYNKFRIFDRLKFAFAFLGIILLILALIENFKSKISKKVQISIKLFIILFIAAFIFQTFGMGLRWYIGGHAPWSNGYEVLLLVAWGGIIAGLSVIRYSKIVLASTAILASIVLMVASMSYYDPQLTNLNPVLKSYWLIIHVAVITIGYGFLSLGFLLGIISILIYLFKSKNKTELYSLVIEELKLVNEKLITIGVFLTAIGTFIGCIWANESWGTYWSWNAKQTWSLIIILVYGTILHFRLIPKMKSVLIFNIGSIIAFGSVIMTFVGVNYYFTKGLHSYASDDPPIFPIWAWIIILSLFALIIASVIKEKNYKTKK